MMEFLRDWGAHFMSAIGIIGGLWAYFRHDRKLKIQEKRLNDMQIRQIQKAEEKERQADIKCNLIFGNRGRTRIRFVNTGYSDALNVRVYILTPKEELNSLIYNEPWGPYKMINPQSYREEILTLCGRYPDTLTVKITWNDSYKKDRTVTRSIQLN